MKKLLLIVIILQMGYMCSLAQKEEDEIMSKYSDVFEWIIKPKYNGIKDIPASNIITFSDNKKGKWGYMTLKEEVIVPCEWGKASPVDAYGFGRVAQSSGDWIYYLDFNNNGENAFGEKNFTAAEPFSCGYTVVGMGIRQKFGIIDSKGNFVLDFTYGQIMEPGNLDDIIEGRSNDWIPVMEFKQSQLGLCGYINNKWEWVLEPTYVTTFPGEGDFYPIEHMWWRKGLLDLEGNLVVPCEYEDMKGITEPLIQVRRKSGWGLLDKSGKEVLPCEYDFISYFDDDGKAYFEKGKQYGYIHAEGVKVEVKGSLERKPIKQAGGYLEEHTYITISYEYKDKNEKKNTYGIAEFADDKVNVKVEPVYNLTYIPYSEENPYIIVALYIGSKRYYGLYNHELKLVIDPKLKEFHFISTPNSDGYMSVAIKDLHGVAKLKK